MSEQQPVYTLSTITWSREPQAMTDEETERAMEAVAPLISARLAAMERALFWAIVGDVPMPPPEPTRFQWPPADLRRKAGSFFDIGGMT